MPLHEVSSGAGKQVYTPTWTGFSANPSGTASFVVIGGICIVALVNALGTSNATGLTMTLPVAPAASSSLLARGVDNGVNLTAPSMLDLVSGNATVSVFKDMNGAAWTGSGSKAILGVIAYLI